MDSLIIQKKPRPPGHVLSPYISKPAAACLFSYQSIRIFREREIHGEGLLIGKMTKKQCMESFKLFGVQIDVAGDNGSTIRKSKSLENLHAFNPENDAVDEPGYLSDGVIHQSSRAHDRKKGKPWSEEEHRSFLLGLEKLGKGNWKGIANNFVPSRDSSQVASHAQKYFIRKSGTEKKRRRPSVFDIPLDEEDQPSQANPSSSSNKPAESSQNIGELKQAAIPVPVTVPEISPMRNPGIPYFYDMLYMPRVSGSAQSISAQAVMPISWVPIPVMDFPGQRSVFLPSTVHRAFTTCATSVPQPSAVTLRQASASTASSDELNRITKSSSHSFGQQVVPGSAQ